MEILSQPPSMTSSLIRLSTFYVTRNKIKSKSPNSERQKKPNVGILFFFFVRVMSFIAFLFAPEPLLQRSSPDCSSESMGCQLTLHLFQGSCEAKFCRADKLWLGLSSTPISFGYLLPSQDLLGNSCPDFNLRWPWPQLAVSLLS